MGRLEVIHTKKIVENGYIIALSTMYGEDISEREHNELLAIIHYVPPTPEGYEYKLRADTLEWELVEVPIDEPQAYTAEQLAEMTNAELSAILAEMGISGSMTKANMIALILDKQSNIA